MFNPEELILQSTCFYIFLFYNCSICILAALQEGNALSKYTATAAVARTRGFPASQQLHTFATLAVYLPHASLQGTVKNLTTTISQTHLARRVMTSLWRSATVDRHGLRRRSLRDIIRCKSAPPRAQTAFVSPRVNSCKCKRASSGSLGDRGRRGVRLGGVWVPNRSVTFHATLPT